MDEDTPPVRSPKQLTVAPEDSTRPAEASSGSVADEGAPPVRSPEEAKEGGETSPRPAEPNLGPANALLRAALGSLVPVGPLGPDSVPAAVLVIPLGMATEELVWHAKRCRRLNCTHVPAPLNAYRRMRPEAIRDRTNHVYEVLWTHPDHELFEIVRRAILKEYDDLANAVSTGTLLEGNKLAESLAQLGAKGLPALAAVLWASRFKGPGADELFRSLVPLMQSGQSSRKGRQAERDEKELKSLEAQLHSEARHRKEAERSAAEALRQLEPKERALNKAQQELSGLRASMTGKAEELGRVQERLREAEAAIQTLQRDGERASRVNSDLRRDIRLLQQTLRELEAERGERARELAVERRRVEHLKLDLESLPRDLQAVREFLSKEEARIQRDRLIVSGGTKMRADEEWANYRKLENAFFEAYPQFRAPRPVKIRRKTPLTLVALGGSGEVGKSCYLIELGKRQILIDCGIKLNTPQDDHPDIHHLEHLDALVLTHAHTDHIGWVPALIRRFPDLDIYCSEGTAALLPVMLEDCYTNYMRRVAASQERAKHIRNAEVIEAEYDEDDVQLVPRLAITCPIGIEERLPFGDASIRFFQAGHILGAASVLIEDQSGRRIFVSGDFSSFDQLTVPAADWSSHLGEVDLLLLESTYGDRQHARPIAESQQELITFVRETTEDRGGSVVLASFALGRAQELLKLIVTAQQRGELSSRVRIHVDGMIRRINPIYRKLADFDVAPPLFNEVSGETERQEVALEAQEKPLIIVTTSGMLAGGPVVEYARRLLPDARHRIVLTGYQDEGAPSQALRQFTGSGTSARKVKILDETGEPIEFEAAMPAKEIGLSAHADQTGLLTYAGRLTPRHIALVHGDSHAQERLMSLLKKVHPGAEVTCAPSELAVP